jgi:hypothetical protein
MALKEKLNERQIRQVAYPELHSSAEI